MINIFFSALFILSVLSAEPLPECPAGTQTVSTVCESSSKVYTDSNPLSSSFINYVLNGAVVTFVDCTFSNFVSTADEISIVHISSTNLEAVTFTSCTFSNNHLKAAVLNVTATKLTLTNVGFLDNILEATTTPILKLIDCTTEMDGCHFSRNNSPIITDTTSSLNSGNMNPFVSLSGSTQLQLKSCCFIVGKNIIISQPLIDNKDNCLISYAPSPMSTVFSCSEEEAFGPQKINTNSNQFIKFSADKCENVNNEANETTTTTVVETTTSDDGKRKEDDDKKITRWIYIGVGCLAGFIIIGVSIVICLRFAGRCKKLEQPENELGDIETKRTSYLLQDDGNEVQEAEL